MQTNRCIADPAERLEDICRSFTKAALSSDKPIILKIGFDVDQRVLSGAIHPNRRKYHLISMRNAGEYVALRRHLENNELRDKDTGLSERLRVSYGEQIISHADFALDGRPDKVMSLYKTLARGTKDGDPMSVDDFPRFFLFMPTRSMLNGPSVHWSRDRFITGHVGDLEINGGAKKILLEEADIYRASKDVAAIRSDLLSRNGTYLIARARVDMRVARDVQADFADAVSSGSTRPVWAKLGFKVYSRDQLWVVEPMHGLLPRPFAKTAKLALTPEATRHRPSVAQDDAPQIKMF